MKGQWVIWAIPAGVVTVLLTTTVLLLVFRSPKPKETDETASPVTIARAEPESVPTPAPPASEPKPEPAPTTPPTAPAPIASAVETKPPVIPPPPGVPTPPAIVSNVPPPAAVPAPGDPAKPPAANAKGARNLVPWVNLPGDAISGTWSLQNGVLRCSDGNAKNRARIRLGPPPEGEFDFSVTFTAEGKKPYVAQILSFKGKQFIWTYFWDDSGFAIVQGQTAHANPKNPTNVPKGIVAGKKYTSVVKLRNNGVAAYLDGELYSSYSTDYSDVVLSNIWSLGPDKSLGIAVECPATIESITITPASGGDAAPGMVKTQPAAPTQLSAYRLLAPLITSPFSTQSSAAATQPGAKPTPSPTDFQPVIATTQPVISDVAKELSSPPTSQPAATDPLLRATIAAAGRATNDTAGVTDPLMERENQGQLADRPASDAERAQFAADQARLAGWRKLLPAMDAIYPKAKAQGNVVKLQVNPGTASFFATNASSTPLSNVTLAVDVVHALTSPSPTSTEYYFIPNWPANQKIYFPANPIPNVASPQLDEIPPVAMPGAGGILGASAQLWSDQLKQSPEPAKFDAKVETIANRLLDEAYRDVDEAIRPPRPQRGPLLVAGPVIPPKSSVPDTAPAIMQAKASAKRAAALVPESSPIAAAAKALIADPQAALRDVRKKQLDEFLAALAPQKSRAGVWILRSANTAGPRKLGTTAGRQAALGAGPDKSGRLQLIIDSRGPAGEVVATLINPDQPTIKRKINGRVHVDASANRLLLQLKSQTPPTRPPTEADVKSVNNWTRMVLDLRGNDLVGIGEVGAGEGAILLHVGFDAPQDVKK